MTETPSRRRCKHCRKVKAASAFSNDSSRPDGKFPWCIDCQVEHGQTHKFQNPEGELNGRICPMCDTPIRGHANRRFCSNTCKDRVKVLKTKFNLTPEQYRKLVADTGGRCPVCGNKPTQWHVEHNHRTREVTGVVCGRCNVGALANTYHDIAFVERLLDYLKNPPAQRVLGEIVLVPEGLKESQPNVHKMWTYRRK